MENNKSWRLTYDLLTTDGVEKIEAQFVYFETCLMTVKNLSKHCSIDNINISLIKQEAKNAIYVTISRFTTYRNHYRFKIRS